MYTTIHSRKQWKRVEGQLQDQKKLAKRVISWISCSKRPLTSSELEHALAVDIGDSELDRENITRVDDMVAFCAGLVTVDKESGITRLVHYTTQEFFDRTKGKWFPNIRTEMTKDCATYLSFDKFESGPCRNDKEFGERLEENRLYDYASHYWGIHAREAAASSTEVIAFLKKTATVEASAQALLVIKSRLRVYSQHFPKQMTGLHLVAYFGIEDIATVFLLHGTTDLKASDGMTPLLWAARNGHEAVVKLLLDTGEVDVDSKDLGYSHTPLLWAAKNGHAAIVKLLLELKMWTSTRSPWETVKRRCGGRSLMTTRRSRSYCSIREWWTPTWRTPMVGPRCRGQRRRPRGGREAAARYRNGGSRFGGLRWSDPAVVGGTEWPRGSREAASRYWRGGR